MIIAALLAALCLLVLTLAPGPDVDGGRDDGDCCDCGCQA